MGILAQAENGVPVPEFCREHGVSSASFYKWRAKYGGMDASMVSQMKSMDDENRHLKKMYTELSMQNDLLKETLGKSDEAIPKEGDGHRCGSAAWHQHYTCLPHVFDQRDVLS